MRRLAFIGVLLFLPAFAGGVSAAPTTDTEAAQLAIVRAVNADPYNFGGVYLTRDGVLAIQYVGDNAGRAAVDEVLMPGVPVRWEKVERSRAELDGMAGDITASNPNGVFEIGVDTLSNQVAVLVGPGGSVSDVEKALTAEYGQAVRVDYEPEFPVVVDGNCVNRENCTRWRGGIEINWGTAVCTWGFQASRNGNLQMITAGHCAPKDGVFQHNGVTIGSNGVSKNSINPATFGGIDVSRTKVNGTWYPTPTYPGQNRLYGSYQYKAWALTSVRELSDFAVGQAVSKSGWRTDLTFGHITQLSVNYRLIPSSGSLVHYPDCTSATISECPFVVGHKTDVYVNGGDSGSPVYSWDGQSNQPSGHVLLGFISSKWSTQFSNGSYFAVADLAATALDLDFWCTTNGCP